MTRTAMTAEVTGCAATGFREDRWLLGVTDMISLSSAKGMASAV
jgi:hypothetical protein